MQLQSHRDVEDKAVCSVVTPNIHRIRVTQQNRNVHNQQVLDTV